MGSRGSGAGDYLVTALTKSKDTTLRVVNAGQRLEKSIDIGRDRVAMGRLQLAHGFKT